MDDSTTSGPHPLPDSLLRPSGVAVPERDAARIWREVALGQWQILAAIDTDGTRHVAIAPRPRPTIHWEVLRYRERQVLALAAQGVPQKFIAAELEVTASTVSEALRTARLRLGFPCLADLLRAYEADELCTTKSR
jgi:DNA-binding NarL/FixJ family response regulator